MKYFFQLCGSKYVFNQKSREIFQSWKIIITLVNLSKKTVYFFNHQFDGIFIPIKQMIFNGTIQSNLFIRKEIVFLLNSSFSPLMNERFYCDQMKQI